MKFSQSVANLNRKNGYLFVARDVWSGYYDIFIQTPGGAYHPVGSESSKSLAIKEAKQMAMDRKLGFDPKLDVVV